MCRSEKRDFLCTSIFIICVLYVTVKLYRNITKNILVQFLSVQIIKITLLYNMKGIFLIVTITIQSLNCLVNLKHARDVLNEIYLFHIQEMSLQ